LEPAPLLKQVVHVAADPEGSSQVWRRRDRLWGWFRLLHPFPSLLVTLATALFAEIAAGGHAAPDRLARLVLAMVCSQFAIGSANDVMDRTLDASAKPWKPLVRGTVGAEGAGRLAAVCCLASLGCAATLGAATLLAMAMGLGCGLAYDLRLKRSIWSWLPYGLAIPTIPVACWAAMDRLTWRLLPVYPLGLLLGVALHLANTLPDLEDDHAFGIRGLAHLFGRRASMLLCWGAFLLAVGLTIALAPALQYHSIAYPIGVGVSLLLVAASMILYRVRPTVATLQTNFGLVALASVALGLGWLAGAL